MLCYSNGMKRALSWLVCVSILFCMAGDSHGYVLPAKQILGFMTRQFGSARTLVVQQKTVIYDSSIEGGMRELDETLYYQQPDQFRGEVSSPEGEQIRVVGSQGAISVTNGRIVAQAQSTFDHFKDLILYRDQDLLLDQLHQHNVNTSVVSLGRYKDRVAYVIGAEYPDESVPQVWVEKASFRPIRYILTGSGLQETGVEEVEYADYMRLDKDRWYPQRIVFYRNGELAKVYVIKTFKINPKLPDQLFDIAYLKTVYQPMVPAQLPPSPASDVDEVTETIRDFTRTFE